MLSLLLSFFIHPLEATTARVLVDEKAHQIEVEGRVRVHCLFHKPKKTVRVVPCNKKNRKNKLSRYSFRPRSFSIKLSKDTLILTDLPSKKRWIIKGRKFRFQGKFKWKGKNISVLDVFSGNRAIHWVVQLPVDKYLQGVLSAEVPSSWPLETLKAQAVASRTYFLWKKKERKSHFDVRSDHMDQVFKMQNQVPPNIARAIRETHNVVLARNSTDYFPAYYHSDCGGETNPEDQVWLKPQAMNKKVQDPHCKAAKRNEWTYKVSRRKLKRSLKSVLPKNVSVLAVMPKRKKQSRAFVVDLLLSNGRIRRVNANEFRKALGFGKLKSTRFSVHKQGKGFVFRGRGYGHGVGMCQWGALRWAKTGKSFEQILRHYYPSAQLAKANSNQTLSPQSIASSQRLE